jgi:hypothetical protein
MEDRPASRTVTAYARGLYLAQIFQLAVAAIAILAVVIGAYMVSKQREELKRISDTRQTEEVRLGEITEEQQTRLAINETLTAALIAMSEARPGDAFASELAYSRAFDTLDKALAQVPGEPLTGGEDPWKETRQTIRRMMVGTLSSAQRLPQAITIQEELLSREQAGTPAWATYSIGLASLHCEAGDAAAAATIVTPELQAAFPDLLNDNAYITACGSLSSPAPDRSAGSAEAEGPAIPSEPAEAAPASSGISRVYLHIRQESQRRAAANVAERLCKYQGLSVLGIELVAAPRGYPVTPRAIYYYPDQVVDAATIAAIVQLEIQELGLSSWDRPFDARLYQADNLPRDRVEIWLPETGGDAAGLGPGKASCTAKLAPAEEVARLVRQLNEQSSADRLSAGQQISVALRGENPAPVIDALLAQLEGANLQALSATGRFNVLYMLNVLPDWQSLPQAERLSAALATIEGRAATVAIGGQTRDCIDKLKTKLSGGAAPDTCGGR